MIDRHCSKCGVLMSVDSVYMTCDRCREYDQRWREKRRAASELLRVCVQCGKDLPKEKHRFSTCPECREKNRLAAAAYRALMDKRKRIADEEWADYKMRAIRNRTFAGMERPCIGCVWGSPMGEGRTYCCLPYCEDSRKRGKKNVRQDDTGA